MRSYGACQTTTILEEESIQRTIPGNNNKSEVIFSLHNGINLRQKTNIIDLISESVKDKISFIGQYWTKSTFENDDEELQSMTVTQTDHETIDISLPITPPDHSKSQNYDSEIITVEEDVIPHSEDVGSQSRSHSIYTVDNNHQDERSISTMCNILILIFFIISVVAPVLGSIIYLYINHKGRFSNKDH